MRYQSYFFSSSPSAGAESITPDGSGFSVSFQQPLTIPKGASMCEIGVSTAPIWNTSYNVSSEFLNNHLSVTHLGTTYDILLADGLYSLDGLNSYIQRALTNLGLPSTLFLLTGDTASQRAVITIDTAGDSVNFEQPLSVCALLGFNPVKITAATAKQHIYSQNQAQLNRTNMYLLLSDLVTNGLPVNARGRGVIGVIPIVAATGSQDNYMPTNILWADCSELIGNSRMNVRFQLVNQSLQATPTSGESYSFTIMLRWE
jgi:hypothetical protein